MDERDDRPVVTGRGGKVSAANSLVGSIAGDGIGNGGVTALSNGNYVVRSYSWNGGFGAVTWGNGFSGTAGVVSAANSLVGNAASDSVGSNGITVLANGNYVVSSPNWTDASGKLQVGAATWGDGTTGTVGTVSSTNSLVGSTANDHVGIGGVTALSNGNYVVNSYSWNAGFGAVTWGNGSSGTAGVVSAANSLVGSSSTDQIGLFGGIIGLANGNYLVQSSAWNNSAGAVTWMNGEDGTDGDGVDRSRLGKQQPDWK